MTTQTIERQKLHVKAIKKTEINGMILQHTQTLPEICYRGCVICFIHFDGKIESVGTRIVDLKAGEYKTLQKLIGMIDFEDEDADHYAARAKKLIEDIKSTAENMLKEFDGSDTVCFYDLDSIRENLIELDFIKAKYDSLQDW